MSTYPWTALLEAWFGGTLKDESAVPARMGWWFGPDADRDATLASEFSDLVEKCANGQFYDWLEYADGRLALVIALDQLPRNLFRGTPRAFDYDAYTAALCLAASVTGQDRELSPIQRAFLYMPLQHFEDLASQEAGVALYQQLADETAQRPYFREGFLPFARQHRDIIARFGRFPHRNATLGRENTPEEEAYLAGGAPRFGQ